jgi:hypothetical protein
MSGIAALTYSLRVFENQAVVVELAVVIQIKNPNRFDIADLDQRP